MELGASFSHRHLKYLGIEPLRAIKEFKNLGLRWMRLGCYWDEIEREPGKFSFSEIEPLIKFCEENKINVVLTIGMKAPRYPEYYLPDWIVEKAKLRRLSNITIKNQFLLEKTLNFIEKTIKRCKKYSAIKAWQIENEPLDHSGEKWWKIDSTFLEKEINLAREMDPTRQIMVNIWGNELARRKLYKSAAELADIVGLDIYPRHPIPIKILSWLNFNRYIGPMDSIEKRNGIIDEIKRSGKGVWITELQAEPWEPEKLVTQKENPPSFLPEHFAENLKYGMSINPSVILLWGFEYWYWRKSLGDLRYWNEAVKLLKKYGH